MVTNKEVGGRCKKMEPEPISFAKTYQFVKFDRFTPTELGSLCILVFCINQTIHPTIHSRIGFDRRSSSDKYDIR